MSQNIFISYRREDSAGYAGHLFDNLSEHFGNDRIFMDIDTIQPGVDFVEAIEKAVSSCMILLVVIGKQWLISDAEGHRRLDNPEDFVRLEIATALKRKITVIPVLVGGTQMPRSDQLPEELTALARRNMLEISDSRWDYDVSRLIQVAEKIMGIAPPSKPIFEKQTEPISVAATNLVVVPSPEGIYKVDRCTWKWVGTTNAKIEIIFKIAQQVLKSLDPKSLIPEGTSKVVANTKSGWRSWGEEVSIALQAFDKQTQITVSSRSAVSTTLVDWGVNEKNVRRVVQSLIEMVALANQGT